jgi:hypothetical protein
MALCILSKLDDMNLIALIEQIRSTYLGRFAAAAAESQLYVEPVARLADGSAALSGELNTPFRHDLFRPDGNALLAVASDKLFDFAPLSVDLAQTTLTVAPFSWDGLSLGVQGLADDVIAFDVRHWFLRWFDEGEANALNAEGLNGVVHFVGDPALLEHAVQFQIDLGSAPAEALMELLTVLANRGATTLSVGSA